MYSSVGGRACWAAEPCPARGPHEEHVEFWSRQTVGLSAGPHPGEHAAPYRRDAGKSYFAESWPWQHSQAGKAHPWSSWYLQPASVLRCFVIKAAAPCDLIWSSWLQAGGRNGPEICFCVSEQREQDEVRRRCASIMYSDPLFWDAAGATGKS